MRFACTKTEEYRGIIANVECKKSTFCNFEDWEQRYIDVTFEIEINNDYYVGKDITFVALTEDEKELHRQKCIFNHSKLLNISYKEYSEAFKWTEGLANTTLQTRKIVLYDGNTVVGSAKVKEKKVIIVI